MKNTTLICPSCGSDHIHHIGVELFNRDEDSQGDHITINVPQSLGWKLIGHECPDNSVDSDMGLNPSARRSGVLVNFICEDCNDLISFGVSQHKGLSIVGWTK